MNPFERFLELVKREVRADSVRVAPSSEEVTDSSVISVALPDKRQLLVSLADPSELEPRRRRLEMLVSTFADLLEGGARAIQRPSKPPVTHSLHEELRALATRARAGDALVIDAHSPIVWGSAASRLAPTDEGIDDPTTDVVDIFDSATSGEASNHASLPNSVLGGAPPDNDVVPPKSRGTVTRPILRLVDPLPEHADESPLSTRAVEAVRHMKAVEHLSRGGHLHASVREADFGFVAHSFASIYVLILVFDAPFDELRAERAILEAMPTIEQLVLALPSLDPDPSPMAGVVHLRRFRRR